MYNSIGLQSPRGSGTNGYVRRNLAINNVKSKDRNNFKKLNDTSVSSLRKLNNDIVEHDRKRKLEIKCLEFQQILEDQGYADDEIEKRVSSYRLSLVEECTSIAAKDERKRTQTRETQDIAGALIGKSDQLRKAFDVSGSFVEERNFNPARRTKETAVEQIIPSPPSSEEEEGEIAEEKSSHKSKKRSGKSSSPKTADSKKKKKKKKKHKRKSKSESHRKHKDRNARREGKRDRRIRTSTEQSSECHTEDRVEASESRAHRRSETPEQYRERHVNNKVEKKSGRTRGFRHPETTEQYPRFVVDDQIEAKYSDSREKWRSKTPEQLSSEKRARHPEFKVNKERERRASFKRSPSVEDVPDCRLTSMSKRRRQHSETPKLDRQDDVHNKIKAKSFESRKRYRSKTPEKKSSEKKEHHSMDNANKKRRIRTSSERSASTPDARNCRSTTSLSSSEKFSYKTNSKKFRKRYSSSPEAVEYESCEERPRKTQTKSELTTKCARKDVRNDRLNEKSFVLRYSDSEAETDEAEDCGSKMTIKQKVDKNDHEERKAPPSPASHIERKCEDNCKSPKPSLNRCSKFSICSLAEKSSRRETDTLNEIPKTGCRSESRTESVKESYKAEVESRSNVERKMACKSQWVIDGKASTTKSEAIEKSPKNMESRAEKVVPFFPKADAANRPAPHLPLDKTREKVEKAAESSTTTLSAADMVDEALKKTATALAINREKTLESLKKLLSFSLPTGKESDSGSSFKSLSKEERAASSNSSSCSSDSSQSSRSRDLSTSFSESKSESSYSSRASSRSYRKRKHRSRKSRKKLHKSRRRSSSRPSETSEASSSRSRSSSKEKKKKKRRKKDRSTSSSSSGSSRSRSTSIPRRKGSPSFLERRRITSNKKKKHWSSSSASTSSGSYTNSSLSSSE